MSTIEDIFYNGRGYYENIPVSEGYKKQIKKCADLSDELSKELNGEQKKLLTELISGQGGQEAESGITHFAEGFKLGLALAAESFLLK